MIPLFRNRVPRVLEFAEYLKDSYASGMMTNFGPVYKECVDLLQKNFSGYWLPVSNGTVALEVALMVGLFRHEKRVAVPDFTFAASANAVYRVGKKPIIMPCDYESRTFNLEHLYNNIDQFDAILVVGAFGYSHRVSELIDLAKKYGKGIVFDYAGSFPSFENDGVCAYSLHSAKSLPIGEGGLVRFNTPIHFEIAKRIINFDFDEKKEAVTPDGLNGKLDELRSAALKYHLLNIEDVYEEINFKRMMVSAYQEELDGICDRILKKDLVHPSMVVLRGFKSYANIIELGEKRGITFRSYYAPLLSNQKGFKKFSSGKKSETRLETYLALPAHVTSTEFKEVVKCIKDASA